MDSKKGLKSARLPASTLDVDYNVKRIWVTKRREMAKVKPAEKSEATTICSLPDDRNVYSRNTPNWLMPMVRAE